MIPVRQHVPGKPLRDVESAVRREIARCGMLAGIKPGARIGVAVGSRGVANMPAIGATVVCDLTAAGARPVILPAMGSHGGATPEGQTAVLAGLGVTPETVGAPIRASMAAEQIGHTNEGVPIWWSREALKCDAVLIINRIKSHTDFRGPIESGLMKMIAVGLGKRAGAHALHSRRVPGLAHHMPEVAREVIRRGHILGGVALIENGEGETVRVRAVRGADIPLVEPKLLKAAKRIAPCLPFDELDALVVDWMGKEISGIGMDPIVIGRMRMPGEMPEFRRPRIRNITALRLTPASKGNVLGVGFCEFIPRALYESIDWDAFRANSMTSGFLERTKVPFVMDSDREAIECVATIGQCLPPEKLRILRIRDTSHVREMWISPALEAEARRLGLEIHGPTRRLRFDDAGNLVDLSSR